MVLRHRKKSRQDQQRERREALIAAGLKVVARYGYTKASVQRITEAAGLAQGTLYSYFNSHQEFLNELLPAEGMRYFRFLSEKAEPAADFFEQERQNFRLFARFLQRNRHFLRVLTDAECAAPESYARHMGNVEERYLAAQQAAVETGQIRPLSEPEMRVVAEILSGAMGHIAIGFLGRPDSSGPGLPEWAADTYAAFVRKGLGEKLPAGFAYPSPDVMRLRPDSRGTRTLLLDAAARVVMRHGFGGATVNAIAEEAGLSVGALYTHFESQQEVFDHLLDHVRVAMLDHVREFTRGAGSFLERELRGFHGFFDFLRTSPWYIRVESEAAVWAPQTYLKHFFDIGDSYVILMRRAKAAGELAAYADRDLPVLACIFMAARHYIAARYLPTGAADRDLPAHVPQAYRALLEHGLSARI